MWYIIYNSIKSRGMIKYMNTTILVVDDEQRMRTLLKDFLVKKDYNVIEAKDRRRSIRNIFRKARYNKTNTIRCYDAKTRWMVCSKTNKTNIKSSNNNAYSKRRRTGRAIWI